MKYKKINCLKGAGLLVLAFIFLVVLTACDLNGLPDDESDIFNASGQIVDENEIGIDDVSIYIAGEEDSITKTDEDGKWEIADLEGGEIIEPAKDGYHFIPSSLTLRDSREVLDILGFEGYLSSGDADIVAHRGQLLLNPFEFENSEEINPFSVREIRKALNYLIDRAELIDIVESAAEDDDGIEEDDIIKYYPNFTHIDRDTFDFDKFEDDIENIEQDFAYNKDEAKNIIETELERFEKDIGEIEIKFLLRDDHLIQKRTGEYVADKLEDIGFDVERIYVEFDEFLDIVPNAKEGKFHITTRHLNSGLGGDRGSDFAFYYTSYYIPGPVWEEYYPEDKKFEEAAIKLVEGDFETWEEREELFKYALNAFIEESLQVWMYGYQIDMTN